VPVHGAAGHPVAVVVAIVLGTLVSGCFDAASPPTAGAARCHIHTVRFAAARTAHYRVQVGLAPARRINPASATLASSGSTEAKPSVAAGADSSRVHLDVDICTTTGVRLGLDAVQSVRLTDGGVASITVPVRRLRPVDGDEPAHFGANVAVIAYAPVVAAITVGGEHATVVLRQNSPSATT